MSRDVLKSGNLRKNNTARRMQTVGENYGGVNVNTKPLASRRTRAQRTQYRVVRAETVDKRTNAISDR